jgi:hypothetical protein
MFPNQHSLQVQEAPPQAYFCSGPTLSDFVDLDPDLMPL